LCYLKRSYGAPTSGRH